MKTYLKLEFGGVDITIDQLSKVSYVNLSTPVGYNERKLSAFNTGR